MEPSWNQEAARERSRDDFLRMNTRARESVVRDSVMRESASERAWRAADTLRSALWELTESEQAIPGAIVAARAFARTLGDHGAASPQIEAALEIAIADVFADLLVSQPGDEIAELDFAERAHQVMTSAFPAPRAD